MWTPKQLAALRQAAAGDPVRLKFLAFHYPSDTCVCAAFPREKDAAPATSDRFSQLCAHDPVQRLGTKNALRCRRCKSEDLAFDTKQTRSADEGATTFVECNGCGARWKP